MQRCPRLPWLGGGCLLLALSLALLPACDSTGSGDWSQYRAPPSDLQFAIDFSDQLTSEPQDGRLILILSKQEEGEPRFQVDAGPGGQQAFGIDVEGLAPGQTATIGDTVFGFPLAGLGLVPAGEYTVQAVLNRYETFHRSDGHTVKLPPDRGEGQQWARKPGNFYSQPMQVHVDPGGGGTIQVTLTEEIPAIEGPADTEWVKHVRMRSELLSDFWGTDVYLGAHVLLPAGYDEHPEAHYPLAVFHGHFPYDFGGWRTEPPEEDLECEYSARFSLDCYNRIQQELAYQLYQDWTSPDFPRMLVIEVQHPTPYYDDSYAVNSENNGPYGDAITFELIPYIEEHFRGIGEGWARFTYGGSTGGWEALAVQIFYPEEYNGAFGACPDPIDFRAYTLVNIYEHDNAYYVDRAFGKTRHPGRRNWLGEISRTLEQDNHVELVLGSKTRSGQQWDVWESVYSPVGDDGYPRRIWDKMTGEIDHEVAEYWKQNYDLSYILRRDWATIGPQLQGKLHIYVGDMDNYYLNNAVYLTEEFLESTTNPYYDGVVDYGDRAEHCWNGDHTRSNALSRLRYIQMYIPRILERVREGAPRGADVTSWRY